MKKTAKIYIINIGGSIKNIKAFSKAQISMNWLLATRPNISAHMKPPKHWPTMPSWIFRASQPPAINAPSTAEPMALSLMPTEIAEIYIFLCQQS